MTTVLSVGNSEGERRCDARCHAAKNVACDCVCAGRYHAKGAEEVLAKVQDDVVQGVFGQTVAIEGRRQLAQVRDRDPDTLRFHRREVHRAITRARHQEQPSLMGAAS